ncbi:ribonucleotide-diphosphate reductase subunit alpha, partial [Roseburia faecis]|nr:ribonucleotide-diphosphate reductase subunit alpha [Roseburia faecis]
PTFLNAGRKRRGEFVSCFEIQATDDMNSIGRTINSALQLSKIGGGVGINLSNLREAGAPIKKIKGAASGVVPVMKLLEDSFSYSNQLGQRQG